MLESFLAVPGRLFVVATLLPLAAFAVLLLVGTVRWLARSDSRQAKLFLLLGGDDPRRSGAFLVLASMAGSAVLGVTDLVLYLNDPAHAAHDEARLAVRWSERIDWVRMSRLDSSTPAEFEKRRETDPNRPVPTPALALELGYRIDHLTALTFAMVALVGTAIVVFSLGYMNGETEHVVEDHEVDRQARSASPVVLGGGHDTTPPTFADDPQTPSARTHFHRRGRFGRFFLYLALFCFSMLNLLIADNLFQVFVSWELVGACSFFLIGFYYERPSASAAANKAFIMNRVGDAGFLIGLLIAWASLGTLNFEEMNRRVRSPDRDTHGLLELADRIVRVNEIERSTSTGVVTYQLPAKVRAQEGSHVTLFPLVWPEPDHFHGLGYEKTQDRAFDVPVRATYTDFGAMPYWLFVVMGLGLFLGCVGKSAQLPLQTWLPDAMEGPTPVSALIHAATMVAAGVYLVGRVFPLFAPEVLLVVAYTGAATLFFGATVALVMTDIKRVLAYSTVSQLGYMMLALGVGGWVAGLLHLLTHAFFKALLFLGAGSVIHGCHHEQDLRKMGGLRAKMRITAFTMLVGVLAIIGTPFFSGWYSKDQILQSALGFGLVHREHLALFLLPLLAAGMTGFYMLRLWFLAFTGRPRDAQVFEHARESPSVMTGPLVFLALFSIGVAWGWPPWDAEASSLGHVLYEAQPRAVTREFLAARTEAHENHALAGLLALLAAAIGVGLATVTYAVPKVNPDAVKARLGGLYRFLARKWYFDELYDRTVTRPTVGLARLAGAFDKRPTETPGVPESSESREPAPRRFDLLTLDGGVNAIGQAADAVGQTLRRVQTGRLRNYILALALTAAAMLAILSALSE